MTKTHDEIVKKQTEDLQRMADYERRAKELAELAEEAKEEATRRGKIGKLFSNR